MATTLTLTIALAISGIYQRTTDNVPVKFEPDENMILELANGTAANQADQLWHDSRSTAGNDDIDFEGGLVDPLQNTLNPARVAALIIKNTTAVGGGNCIIGAVGGATALLLGFGANTHSFAVPPGGLFVATRPDSSGWATAAGADILRVASSSGTVTYEIWAVLKSA